MNWLTQKQKLTHFGKVSINALIFSIKSCLIHHQLSSEIVDFFVNQKYDKIGKFKNGQPIFRFLYTLPGYSQIDNMWFGSARNISSVSLVNLFIANGTPNAKIQPAFLFEFIKLNISSVFVLNVHKLLFN